MESVEICNCGHEKYHHKEDDTGLPGYCRAYLYDDFEMKCTCQQFNPFMKLTDQDDIYNLTDVEETPYESDEEDVFE